MNFIKFEIESREAAKAVTALSREPNEKVEYSRNKPKYKINTSNAAILNTIAKKACIFCNSNFYNGLECKKLTHEQKRYKLKREG